MNPLKVAGNHPTLFLFLAVLPVMAVGCATGDTQQTVGGLTLGLHPSSSASQAEPQLASFGQGVDLKQYRIATVLPFAMEAGEGVDPLIGDDFADDIYERLRNSLAGVFEEVRKGPALGANGELVVTGTIKKYNPGSKAGRAIFTAFVGAASFEADLTLKDAKSGQMLMSAPINELTAYGGPAGASRGIENMMVEAAAAAAATIAHAKGWEPSPR